VGGPSASRDRLVLVDGLRIAPTTTNNSPPSTPHASSARDYSCATWLTSPVAAAIAGDPSLSFSICPSGGDLSELKSLGVDHVFWTLHDDIDEQLAAMEQLLKLT
jgi:hypothetical protein